MYNVTNNFEFYMMSSHIFKSEFVESPRGGSNPSPTAIVRTWNDEDRVTPLAT